MQRFADSAVLWKPPTLATEAPDPARVTLVTIARAMLNWPELRLPHRLDAPTQGLIVVARDANAVAALNGQIRQGQWRKVYIAIVSSDPSSKVGLQQCYLRAEKSDSGTRRSQVVRSGGDKSSLELIGSALDDTTGGWQLAIELHTGRYHQIRAMCEWLGFPLIGDALYGGPDGELFLEHVALQMPDPTGTSSEFVTVTDQLSPSRTRIHPALLESAMARLDSPAGWTHRAASDS